MSPVILVHKFRKMNKHNCRQINYFCISCLSICYKLYGTLDNRWFVIKEGPRLRSRNYHLIQISERDQIQIRYTVTLSKQIRMINFLFVTTAIIIVSHTSPQETDSATVVVISFYNLTWLYASKKETKHFTFGEYPIILLELGL